MNAHPAEALGRTGRGRGRVRVHGVRRRVLHHRPGAAGRRRHGDVTGQSTARLAGITVVAMEQAVAAPMCTRVLADFGARVIKVENPNGGDFARDYDDVVNGPGGLAAHFVWCNRGKESVTLNTKSPAGHGRCCTGCSTARTRSCPTSRRVRRRGWASPPADLAERHPNVIPVEIDGYGPGGPISHKRAYDLLVQAESGSCAVTGYPGMPAKPGPAMADFTTGLYAALSILALLVGRGARSAGAAAPSVELSLFDVMTDVMGYHADLHPALRHRPATARCRLARRRAVRRLPHPRRSDRGARHHQRPRMAAGRPGDHRPARPRRRPALRHQPRSLRAPRDPRRGHRILVCATRSRRHPEDGGRQPASATPATTCPARWSYTRS